MGHLLSTSLLVSALLGAFAQLSHTCLLAVRHSKAFAFTSLKELASSQEGLPSPLFCPMVSEGLSGK